MGSRDARGVAAGFFLLVVAVVPAETRLRWQVERALTSDGYTIVMKRYPRPGSPPVVLVHGTVQNGAIWDLPVRRQSLARYLARRGYDVWIPSLRGHGKGGLRSPHRGRLRWSVDELACRDMPAIVDEVIRRTGGKRPFLIGHSLGGILCNLYLQGVRLVRVPVERRKGDVVLGWRVAGDPLLAARRNRAVAGVVPIAGPPTYEWPSRRGGLAAWRRDNHLAKFAARSWQALYSGRRDVPALPVGSLVSFLRGQGVVRPRLFRRATGLIARTFFFTQVWNTGNLTPRLAREIIDRTVDDTSGRLLLQYCDWTLNATMREFHIDDPLRSPYVYADHYQRIEAPVCVIAGERDRLVYPLNLERRYLPRIASKDVTYRVFAGFGHVDLVVGRRTPGLVYPFIEAWMRSRAQRPGIARRRGAARNRPPAPGPAPFPAGRR